MVKNQIDRAFTILAMVAEREWQQSDTCKHILIGILGTGTLIADAALALLRAVFAIVLIPVLIVLGPVVFILLVLLKTWRLIFKPVNRYALHLEIALYRNRKEQRSKNP